MHKISGLETCDAEAPGPETHKVKAPWTETSEFLIANILLLNRCLMPFVI